MIVKIESQIKNWRNWKSKSRISVFILRQELAADLVLKKPHKFLYKSPKISFLGWFPNTAFFKHILSADSNFIKCCIFKRASKFRFPSGKHRRNCSKVQSIYKKQGNEDSVLSIPWKKKFCHDNIGLCQRPYPSKHLNEIKSRKKFQFCKFRCFCLQIN